MISLHLKDGQTIPIDLDDGASEYLTKLSRSDFQEQLTAVTIQLKFATKNGEVATQFSVVRPKGFEEQSWFQVEKVAEQGRVRGGERLDLFIGEIRVSLMAHGSQPAARISITKLGRRKFNPAESGSER